MYFKVLLERTVTPVVPDLRVKLGTLVTLVIYTNLLN